jgi:hypothetical protein
LPRDATNKINEHLPLEVFHKDLPSIILFEPVLIVIASSKVDQDVEHVYTIQEHVEIP